MGGWGGVGGGEGRDTLRTMTHIWRRYITRTPSSSTYSRAAPSSSTSLHKHILHQVARELGRQSGKEAVMQLTPHLRYTKQQSRTKNSATVAKLAVQQCSTAATSSQCSTTQNSTVQYHSVQYSTTQYTIVQYSRAATEHFSQNTAQSQAALRCSTARSFKCRRAGQLVGTIRTTVQCSASNNVLHNHAAV